MSWSAIETPRSDAVPSPVGARDRDVERRAPSPAAVSHALARATTDPAGALDWLDRELTRHSDRDLLDWLERETVLGREEMAGLRDVARYVRRLAEIGLATEPEARDTPLHPVHFARFLDPSGRGRAARHRFSPHAGRLYATFDVPPNVADHVTVRWRREGEAFPRVLKRQPIARNGDRTHVWLRPEGSWSPGTWEVAIYGGDEEARLVALGSYEIDAL